MKFNKYQLEIDRVVKTTNQNVVVDAKAGTGKTTTIKQVAGGLDPSLKTLFVAFNKSIVQELSKSLPENVECCTLHSKGFQIVRQSTVNGKVKLDNYKVKNIIKDLSVNWGLEAVYQDQPQEVEKYCKRVNDLANLARMFLVKNEEELEAVAEKYDILISNGEINNAFSALKLSGKMRAKVDYTDMIYHAVRYGEIKDSDKYDVIFIDEAQDLNKVQQALIFRLLKKSGRFVAVGDPSQSIYGFAGADTDSFLNFTKRPNTVVLPLNECYRCGKEIIKLAQTIVPEIEAFENSDDGVVDMDAEISSIDEESFVMCRNTRPLVSLFFLLLRSNIASHIVGRDMAKRICNIIKKTERKGLDPLFNELDKMLLEILNKLAKKYPEQTEEELKGRTQYLNFSEIISILNVIRKADKSVKNSADLKSKVYEMFDNKNGGAILCTIHRAKGLEAHKCFIVRPDLMPSKYAKQPWQKIQEENLRYVAYTRAKKYLGVINFEEL